MTTSNLVDWIRWQQIAYERGELGADQIKALEAMPKWCWLSDDDKREITKGWPGLLDPAQVPIVWGHDGMPSNI